MRTVRFLILVMVIFSSFIVSSAQGLDISGIPDQYYDADVIDQYPLDYGKYNPDVARSCGGEPSTGGGTCINGKGSGCRYFKYNDCLRGHWWRYGRFEGRRASPSFDPRFYKDIYADLRNAYGNNWAAYVDHYAFIGRDERPRQRTGSLCDYPFFSTGYYFSVNPDLAIVGNNSFRLCQHWENNGIAEGRVAFPAFSATAYKQRYADLQPLSNYQVMIHYVTYGQYEGRNPRP